jgi:hypothetical protein
MSAASIPPEKLALYGALAIGAYWFLTHRAAYAGTGTRAAANRGFFQSPAVASQKLANYNSADPLSAIATLAGALFRNGRAPGYTEAVAGQPNPSAMDSRPYTPFENGLPSSTEDGFPANPPNNQPIDALDPNAWGAG